MPLSIAKDGNSSSTQQKIIVDLLENKGARSTWRREFQGRDNMCRKLTTYDVASESSKVDVTESVDRMCSSHVRLFTINSASDRDFEDAKSHGNFRKISKPTVYHQNHDDDYIFSSKDFNYMMN